MDIGNLVNYEAPHTYELKDVVSGDGLGIIFTLTSALSDAPKAVVRHHIDSRYAKKKSKPITSKEGEELTLNTLVASVTGWDWGDNTFNDEDLSFSVANVKNILTLAPWIADQLRDEVDDIENFSMS